QLTEKNYDYWALGHIHKRTVLQETPPIIYPGNVQGRHRKELGEKGCVLVTLASGTATHQFYPLATIEFAERTVNLNRFSTIDQLEQHCSELLDQFNQEKLLLTLKFETTEA